MVSIIEEENGEQQQQEEEEEEAKPQIESESSPLRSNDNLTRTIISTNRPTRAFSPLRSPKPPTPSSPVIVYNQSPLGSSKTPTPQPQSSPVIVYNQSTRDDPSVVSKVDPAGATHKRGDVEQGGGEKKSSTPAVSGVWRQRREAMVNRALLGFRICGIVFCLISFSVMAVNKTRGWAGDSFDRYKEYRYCLSVGVIGFVYGGFQVVDLVRYLVATRHFIHSDLRCYFDFCMDQILAYLLMSASSAAASRVEDWESNWGKDEFTDMASASIGMSFLAFIAFAFCSLISGYNLVTRRHS